MITRDPNAFLKRFRELDRDPLPTAWTMRSAMLVDPTGFRISQQSATDNHYMNPSLILNLERAKDQHAAVVKRIEQLGVGVKVFPGKEGFEDGIYPNNAFATRPGKLIIGHMFHPVRQQETKRQDIIAYFTQELGYSLEDLSERPNIAELTGVMIIDHRLGIGYCGLGNRCDEQGCADMHDAFGLRMTFMFDLVDEEYHTNIVLSCLAGKAIVIYPSGFKDPKVATAITSAYEGKAAILTREEKMHFMGNCLAITPNDMMVSSTALPVITPTVRSVLEKQGFQIHWVDVDELEKGGGSLRCLIAEIF